MRKFLKNFAAVLTALCVLAPRVALDDSASVRTAAQTGILGAKYFHTQKSVVSWSGYSAYRAFMRCGEKSFVIPGLDEGFVPQGLTFCEVKNSFMLSGYNADGGAAYILTVNADSGRMNGEYKILKSDGTDFTGHSGGIVSFGRYVYLTDGYFLYYIPQIALSGGSKNIRIEGEIRLPVSASFITVFDGYLWAGNFYHKSYANNFDVSVKDGYGKQYRTLIAAYRLDAKKRGGIRTSDERGTREAVIYAALAAPDEVQGAAFLPNGDVHLSCSYGRGVMSSQFLYSYPLKEECDGVVSVGKRVVPLWFLNNDRIKRSLSAPPMSEGVVFKNGRSYVIFESAAQKYRDTAMDPTDCVWAVNWAKK